MRHTIRESSSSGLVIIIGHLLHCQTVAVLQFGGGLRSMWQLLHESLLLDSVLFQIVVQHRIVKSLLLGRATRFTSVAVEGLLKLILRQVAPSAQQKQTTAAGCVIVVRLLARGPCR